MHDVPLIHDVHIHKGGLRCTAGVFASRSYLFEAHDRKMSLFDAFVEY